MVHRISDWRPGLALALGIAFAAALIIGCGASRASDYRPRPPSLQAKLSLGECVSRWNKASLGNGRLLARVDAVEGGFALMFTLPDSACGLAFPRGAAPANAHQPDPLVNVLGGNYALRWSPLGIVSSSNIARFQADANRRTNVIVEKSGGKVLVRPRASIPAIHANVFVNAPGCGRVIVPGVVLSGRYNVIKATVDCLVVRTLIWAWTEEENSPTADASVPRSTLRIIGWRCVGANLIPGLTPPMYEKVTCTSGIDVVEARSNVSEIA
jgi:hypothetical protein